jgi:signal transduction histidine kinase
VIQHSNQRLSAMANFPESLTPAWAAQCLTAPAEGVEEFLNTLRVRAKAEYAHIRVVSRFGKFYTMVRSIGPYSSIGWRRRFQLIDARDIASLAFKVIDYSDARDCALLKAKFAANAEHRAFLESLTHGFWVPIQCANLLLGYVTLSWTKRPLAGAVAADAMEYMRSVEEYMPLLFSACRSVLTEQSLRDLWAAARHIQASTSVPLCYDRIAEACVRLWGADITVYIGKPHYRTKQIEIVTVDGYRAHEANRGDAKQTIPLGEGLLGFALTRDNPVVSPLLATDQRFRYHSMKLGGGFLGSAIAMRLVHSTDTQPLAVISVEHEMENYFDSDDLRYITAIANIGSAALGAHHSASERVAREIDTLFTQISHDVAEPLTALVADADVLSYEAGLFAVDQSAVARDSSAKIAGRAANILETSLELNSQVRKHLDLGLEGAATRVTEGRVNLYRVLSVLMNIWEGRAANQGIELRAEFDAFRGVEVRCDETELKAALGHLFGNAIKYSFWGGRQAPGSSVKFGRYVRVAGWIKFRSAVIEIQNYGIGILHSELSAIKDKFYRGELAKREGRAGTGRGLWSANSFFEGLGGSLTVSSEFKGGVGGQGTGPYFTRVRVSLPYQAAEE